LSLVVAALLPSLLPLMKFANHPRDPCSVTIREI
jgi:hypothetical protein